MADVDDSNFFINENYSAGIISEATRQNLKKRAQGEFLLLQNIRNEGWYKSLPGYGLLVWRIDYADKDYVSLYDYQRYQGNIQSDGSTGRWSRHQPDELWRQQHIYLERL